MGYKLDKVLEQLRNGIFRENILYLNEDKISDTEVQDLALLLKEKKPDIKEIYLHENQIGDNGAIALANAFAEMKALESVVMSKNKISAIGASVLINNSCFEKLDLHCNAMNRGNLEIKNSKHFKELNLSECQLEAKSIHSLVKMIKVVNLDLGCNYLGDAAFEVLSAIEGLEIINLEQNSIICKFEAKQHIINFFERNKSLHTLDLGLNLISKGVHIIADVLTSNRTLKKLHLGWNQIGKEGILALKNLSELDVDVQYNPGSEKVSFFIKQSNSMVDVATHHEEAIEYKVQEKATKG